LLLVVIGVGGCNRSAPSLQELVTSTAKEHDLPGMVALATRSDGTIETTVFGSRHAGHSDPVAATDQFHIGSNTKAMTATLIAKLVEDAKLSWETKLLDVFPEWSDEIHPDYRPVTLWNLLNCRAGVPAYANFSYLFSDDPIHRDDGSDHVELDKAQWREMTSLSGTPQDQRRQFARLVLSRPPAARPRTQFLYSNASYGIAGAMVEKITGESWEAMMRTRLFEPLGIQATFDWPAADDPHQPWGHFQSKSGPQPHDPNDSYHLPACLAPGGGVSMSIEDYAKFLRLHLQGMRGHDGLLRAKTIQYLHAKPEGADENSIGFAFGWGLVAFEGSSSSWCEGSAGTFYAGAVLLPSKDLAAAVFANIGTKAAGAGGVEILKWAAHHYPSPDRGSP